MTCARSRTEYIEAVTNVVQMSRHLCDFQDEHVATLREAEVDDALTAARSWRVYVESMRRLLDEQAEALERFESDAARHPSRAQSAGGQQRSGSS